MRRRWLVVLLAAMLCLALFAPLAQAQDPVTLDFVDNYVIVRQDGTLRVTYTLTFTEREAGGRKLFNAVGQFPDRKSVV